MHCSVAPADDITIGISSCLLGEQVRFDGQHKRDAFLCRTVGKFVRWVPVCPEVELGLGIPREPIQLRQGAKGTELVTVKGGQPLTARMRRYARRRARELARHDLCGYVFKKDSPSCGLFRVRVYQRKGPPRREGRGLFAEALVERYPHLPVEEEGRLNDPGLRENFFERVFAYRRLKLGLEGRFGIGRLVDFHASEKLLLMAHSPKGYRELGRLVAGAKALGRSELVERYHAGFMGAMASQATPGRHANVLQHIAGYFRKTATQADRDELAQLIADYRAGLVPLVVPITLVRHLVRRYDVGYLAGQTYLEPHPKELMLRNHV